MIRSALWRVIRLIAAGGLLWAALWDHKAREARLALAALPAADHAAIARELCRQNQFAEAEQIILAGLADADSEQQRASLALQLRETIAARDDALRKFHSFMRGAVTGTGEDLESLLGAISADLFVIGDVRDLLIQSARWTGGEDADEVLIALSAAGLATTVMPHLDAGGALVKAARRAGGLTEGMGRSIRAACAQAAKGRLNDLQKMMRDLTRIADKASPAVAVRCLRWADEPADLARAASLAARPNGGAALLLTGPDCVQALRKLGPAAETAVLCAAKRAGGQSWLRTSAAMFRPHPLLGLSKGLYKGNVSQAAIEAMYALDRAGWLVIPALAAWLYLELCWFVQCLARVRVHEPGGSPVGGAGALASLG